jgi:hypothetical protein
MSEQTQRYRRTPLIDPEDGSMTCRRCGHYLAKNCDGIFLLAGGIRLFGDVKYHCHHCLKPHRFEERKPDDDPLFDESFEVLNSLASEDKFKTEDEENFD